MTKGKCYTEEQIIKVLKEIDAGARIASMARTYGVTDQANKCWREQYAGWPKACFRR